MSLRLEICGTDVRLVLRRNTVFFLTCENIISISFEISCIISIMMGEVIVGVSRGYTDHYQG